MSKDRDKSDHGYDKGQNNESDRSGQTRDSDRGGSFHDHVEKLERPGEWPDPPAEEE